MHLLIYTVLHRHHAFVHPLLQHLAGRPPPVQRPNLLQMGRLSLLPSLLVLVLLEVKVEVRLRSHPPLESRQYVILVAGAIEKPLRQDIVTNCHSSRLCVVKLVLYI